MHAARDCAQQLLLPASAGNCGGARASEAARPNFHRPCRLRQPPAPGCAVARGDPGWPPRRPAADAEARTVGGRAEAEHQQAASQAQALSVPSAWQDGRPAEPSVGGGHHLHRHATAFLYLVAIIDWATRRGLSWRLSNTLMAGFCVEALSEAVARFGKPGICNTDQSLPSRKRGARNSPARSSPRCCGITRSRSAWTDAGAATTTSLSSVCGGP